MDTLKIELATQNDAPYISLLGRITFTETFGHLFRNKNELLAYYERTFSVQKIRNSIAQSNNIFWIAFIDELPVGYAKLKVRSDSEFIHSENVAQLQKIYVLKDFISRQVGLKLQETLIDKAIEKGSEIIWLSVLNSNERAIRFYSKNGFIEAGAHDFQIGSENFNFLVMSRGLQ